MTTNDNELMMNQTTKEEVLISDSAIDFRLDILRLTFTIEHLLEVKISNIFNKKSKILLVGINEWMEEKEITNLKNLCNDKAFLRTSISTSKEGERFLLDNFLNNSQFGNTLELLGMVKMTKIAEAFDGVLGGVDFSTLKRWYIFIKDIRNLLAHRTKIDPLHFFEKLQTPATPSRQGKDDFKKLSDIEKRKFVIKFLLEGESSKEVIKKIIEKYF